MSFCGSLARIGRVLAVLLLLAAPAAAEKPDVLFIAIDDLNDWTGCLGGHPQASTPHLDRLVSRGTLFTNAQCAAPACNPSRAALMSGLRPFTTGVYLNSQPYGEPLRNVTTLNRYLIRQGYEVIGGGKIYHGGGGLAKENQADWHEYFDRGGDPHPPVKSVSGLNMAHFDWGPLDAPDEEMGDYRLVSWASEQLQRKHDKPLFLAVGFVKPHLPWYAPRKYFDMFPLDSIVLPKVKPDDLDDVPAAGAKMARPEGDHAAVLAHNQWKQAVQGYLATIKFLDEQIGRLADAVDRSGRADDLVIVLWSDHGWHLGEKQHWRKFALWEEATRAPLAFIAPGVTKPGSQCDAPVDFMSIYPTLIDLIGLGIPGHIEGPSLRPLLENPQVPWDRGAITTHGRGNHGVRDRQWRYIRYADGSEELYDHHQDPYEWKNLAGLTRFDAVKQRLAGMLPEQEAEDAPKGREKAEGVKPRAKKGKKTSVPAGGAQ
ncbi:MAG: sulfatase [Rhodopirellula sp.]|nr:sulfatase [Rhodopirellula sp.]